MRVLLLIRRLDYGGAEDNVVDLANALVRGGHRVTVAAGRGRRVRDLAPLVRFRQLRFAAALRPFTVTAVRRLIDAERVDIVHAHQREPAIVGALACSKTTAPLVATLHSRVDWDFDLPWVRQAVSRLFVPSEAWIARVGRMDSGLAERSVVIPNGLVSARIKTPARSRLRVLYASRIDRFHARALAVLIREAWPRVVRRVPRCELAIAGDGPCFRSIRREARRTNRRLGREAVHMLGYCPELDPHLARAGLVLGVGRVALEAAGQGTPVLLVNDIHLGPRLQPTNVHQHARDNFVPVCSPPPNAARLSARICGVLESYDNARVEAQLVALVVRSRYDQQRFVPIVEQQYHEAVDSCIPERLRARHHVHVA